MQDGGGAWTDAPWIPGALTVNVGDVLALWSGGRWRSANHRVLPPPVEAPDESLVSLVYFAEADARTLIEPITGHEPAVRSHDHLQRTLAEISVAPLV